MKNIIKYILILFACLAAVTFFFGCGQDTPSHTVYKSPFSEIVDTRNTDIINKSNNAVEITVKYDMDKETDSFVDESIRDMNIKDILYLVEK